ncbi:MAG: hypothetical protein ABI114_16200 [Rhodanobacter sp.]
MIASRLGGASKTPPRFALWSLAVWVVLLLAMMGAVQYLRHANFIYLAAAAVTIVACAGCVMRQSWARTTLRVLCVVLALWALISGALMVSQWGSFAIARQHALAQPALTEMALWLIARAQRTWEVALGLKAASIPLLLWLAWQLGQPRVRAQFKRRR